MTSNSIQHGASGITNSLACNILFLLIFLACEIASINATDLISAGGIEVEPYIKPPYPPGIETTYRICPRFNHVANVLLSSGLPIDGIWEPPWHETASDPAYNSNVDGASVYIYQHSFTEYFPVQGTETIPYSGNNPPCPTGHDTTIWICPRQEQVEDMLAFLQLPLGGAWEPPLYAIADLEYNSCYDSSSAYIYTTSSPGCPDVQDTVHFSLLWHPPCNSVIEACFTTDSFIITVPTFTEFSGDSYELYFAVLATDSLPPTQVEDFGSFILNPDSTYVISGGVSWDNFDYEFHCTEVWLSDPVTDCSFVMGVYVAVNWNCGVLPCGECSNPPYAGGNNAIDTCIDAEPFDLTTILLGNPDPGGTWNPPLISGGNIYDPIVDGSGAFIYSVDGGSACPDDEATVNVTVQQLIIPDISGVPNEICENDTPINLPVVQDGILGNWSGAGTSNNMFDPSGLNGVITLTFIPDPGQCAVSATIGILVEPFIIIILSGLPDSLCQLNAPIPLPASQSGVAGNWSGQGVNGNTFNPANLSGNIILTFTPYQGQCADPVATSVVVETAITPLINGIPDSLCQLLPPVQLPIAPSGINGNWSGTGVVANAFNPEVLNGNVILTFTPDAGQCAMNANATIFVEPAIIPVIIGIVNEMCENDLPIALPPIQNNINGMWSGPGVSSNEFNPAGLTGIITLTFTPDPDQCSGIAIHDLDVTIPIVPVIAGLPDSLCGTSPPLQLLTIQSGITGNWTGQGVVFNSFDPLGQNGNTILTFIPSPGQCAYNTAATITVVAPVVPVISGIPDSVCETTGPVVLSTIQSGIPGNWSGPGVSANTFYTTGLTGNVNLLFSPNTNLCTEPTSIIIVIDPLITPLITGIPGSFCQMDPLVLLPNSISTITGNWSGQGVSNNTFNPTGLNGNTQLSFIPNTNLCADTAFIDILVNSTPSFTNLMATCDSSTQSYLVSFEITGGLPGSYIVNGMPVGSSLFTSLPIGADTTSYMFALDDANGCGPVAINGSVNCACATSAGTMDFSISPIKICEGDDFMVVHHQDQTLDPDDLLQYVLHDQAGTQLGTIYAWSNQTLFNFPSGISSGQIYYISAVAGSIAGNGSIDLNDPCLSVSQGVPVIFYQPSQGAVTATLCSGDSLLVNGTIYHQSNPTGLENFPGGNIHGCDSIISVNLAFYPVAITEINQTLCFGGNITVNGTIYNELQPTGTELIENGALHGCDSTVHISLTFDSVAIENMALTLCSGDSAEVNGIIYDESNPTGSQLFAGGSYMGCDSILQLQLSFYPPSIYNVNETICPGESIVINGEMYDEHHLSGNNVIQGGNIFGCDSVVEVMLTVIPEAKEFITDTLQIGDSLIINGTNYNQGYPAGIEVLPSGSYLGCDSIIEISLYFSTALAAVTQVTAPACFGESNGRILIEAISGGLSPFSISLNQGPFSIIPFLPYEMEGLPAGSYQLTIMDVSATTIILNFAIPEAEPLVVDAGADQLISYGEDIQLDAISSGDIVSWTWSPPDFLSCTNCPDPLVKKLTNAITYTVMATDIHACTESDDISIMFKKDQQIYFPNVFSPNGDGINDIALLYSDPPIAQISALSIFSRWGECIFRQNNFPSNDPGYGWDGTLFGKALNPGAYVWVAEVKLNTGTVEFFSGDVTLLR